MLHASALAKPRLAQPVSDLWSPKPSCRTYIGETSCNKTHLYKGTGRRTDGKDRSSKDQKQTDGKHRKEGTHKARAKKQTDRKHRKERTHVH